jgi:hypothetical protein
MRPIGLLALLVAASVAACPGDAIPPPEIAGPPGAPLPIDRDPTRELMLGTVAVTLESTTLAQVAAAAGVGRIDHAGDAGASQAWLCYTWTPGGQRLWLASGELQGGEVVDEFVAMALRGPAMATDACPELPPRLAPVRPAGGPWLGSGSAQVLAEYGDPGTDGHRWWYANESSKGEFDTFAYVEFEFDAGTARVVRMGRATSN